MDNENAPIPMILQQLLHLSKYQGMHLLNRFDLKPGQAGILFVLNHYGHLTQRELAEKIGITPPSMTVAIRKMEEKGYIAKTADERDQRKTQIYLTEKGSGCIDGMKQVFRQMEDVMFRGFLQEERLLLRRYLLQMSDNILNSRELEGVDVECVMKQMAPREDEF